MKRAIVALAAVLCLCLPVMAGELDTEATGSFSWSDTGEIRVWDLGGAVDFPVSRIVQIGPVFQFGEVRVPGANVQTRNLGGRATFNLMGRDGLFLGLGAMYNTAGALENYTIVPEVGIKWGGDGGFLRVSASYPYLLNDSKTELIDLGVMRITAGFGARF